MKIENLKLEQMKLEPMKKEKSSHLIVDLRTIDKLKAERWRQKTLGRREYLQSLLHPLRYHRMSIVLSWEKSPQANMTAIQLESWEEKAMYKSMHTMLYRVSRSYVLRVRKYGLRFCPATSAYVHPFVHQ